MSRLNVLIIPFAIFIWACSMILFIKYSQTAYQQVEEQRSQYAVNYAVDAAVDVLLTNTADLQLDYADYESIAINPKIALDVFLQIFCKNYGMSLSDQNYSIVKMDYLNAFVVATYDGYYIGKPEIINDSGARDIIFSMKQPYLYEGEDGYTYALNLGYKDAKRFDGLSITKVSTTMPDYVQKEVVSSSISDALMSTVFETKDGNVSSAVYIPTGLTAITGTNAVEGVTVFAYVTDPDVSSSGEKLEVLGIGGSKLTHTSYCSAYIKDGKKMYCFAEDTPPDVEVIETYLSPEDAAEHGYYFDLSTL